MRERLERHPAATAEGELVDDVRVRSTVDGVAHVGYVGSCQEVGPDASVGDAVGVQVRVSGEDHRMPGRVRLDVGGELFVAGLLVRQFGGGATGFAVQVVDVDEHPVGHLGLRDREAFLRDAVDGATVAGVERAEAVVLHDPGDRAEGETGEAVEPVR